MWLDIVGEHVWQSLGLEQHGSATIPVSAGVVICLSCMPILYRFGQLSRNMYIKILLDYMSWNWVELLRVRANEGTRMELFHGERAIHVMYSISGFGDVVDVVGWRKSMKVGWCNQKPMATCFLTNTNTLTAVLQCSCISCKRTYILLYEMTKLIAKVDVVSNWRPQHEHAAGLLSQDVAPESYPQCLHFMEAFHGSIHNIGDTEWSVNSIFVRIHLKLFALFRL